MKRLIGALLCLTLVFTAGCAGEKTALPTPEPTPELAEPTPDMEELTDSFSLTRDTMPRLDGSTSTAPLALAVCARVLGESEESVGDLVRFSKTTNAYMNLISGEADLLIVGEANEDVIAEKERLGFEWEKEPFATDAFVFVVNENNPVDSITVDEARKIYTGEIKNWSELGGEDMEIIALQRNEGAGSQAIMEKLVMQGEKMMDAPEDYVVATMGDLMTAVKSYDASAGAIGYTVYYYAEEMKMAKGLKMLQIDGVAPEPDTIRSESYPLVNPKYVVIPASAEENAPNRLLRDWMLSRPGQQLIADMGYVSIMALDVSTPSVPLVGGRVHDGYTDHLIQSEDYGILIPYAGERLFDDWPASTGCKYGLMTADGNVVVDPVYSNVYAPWYYESYCFRTHPMLVLERGVGGEKLIRVAARDGSWQTTDEYDICVSSKDGLTLFTKSGVVLMSPDGSIQHSSGYAELGLSEEQWNTMRSEADFGDGIGGSRKEEKLALWMQDDFTTVCCYDFASGQRDEVSVEDWWSETGASSFPQESYPVEGAEKLHDELLGDGAPGLLSVYSFTEGSSKREYYLEDGTFLPELTTDGDKWYELVSVTGGLIEVLSLNYSEYLDLQTGECVFRTFLGYEPD